MPLKLLAHATSAPVEQKLTEETSHPLVKRSLQLYRQRMQNQQNVR